MDGKDVKNIILQENACWSPQQINKDTGYQAEDWGAPNWDLALLAASVVQGVSRDVHIPPQE